MRGTVCILFVLVIRFLLRKKPRSFSYVLWAVVFLRLLCPFSLRSSYFGLTLGGVGQALESAAYQQEAVHYQLLIHKDGTVETLAGRNMPGDPGAQESGEFWAETFGTGDGAVESDRGYAGSLYQNTVNRRYTRSEVLRMGRYWVTLCSLAWAAGVAILLGYSILSYMLLHRRLRQAVRVQEDVYESERIDTPFLLGILNPRIYLPVGLPKEERAYVLAHELAHLRRGDYLVKLATWLALSLHWFNPLVWLAYGLMSRDMEMSCDERVIRRLGEGSKKAYSQTLLSISEASGGARERRFSVPLSFGEDDIGGRVKNVLAYRRVKAGTAVALTLALGAAGLVLLTDWQGAEKKVPIFGADREAAAAGKQRSLPYSESAQILAVADELNEEDIYDLREEAEAPKEGGLDPWEVFREMDRGAGMTWEQLQDPDTGLDYWLGVCY